MVGLLDRYIGIQVIAGTMLALALLLSVFSFLDFREDQDSVGQGNYTRARAVEHMLLTMPTRAFALFPPAALIGTLLGLGALASSRELIAMRAAGISQQRIALSVMKAGAILVILAIAVGELVSPNTEQIAQTNRAEAMSKKQTLRTAYGYWVRDKNSFINIRNIAKDGDLEDVYIYEFDAARKLRTSTHAKRASHTGESWQLVDIVQSELSDDGIQAHKIVKAEWHSPLLPDLVTTVRVSPESLSVFGLVKYIRYLRENGLASARFDVALLNKFVFPLATAVMIYLAVSIILVRNSPMQVGQRIVIGALVGVGFHIIHNTSIRLGLVYDLSPIVTALLPTLVFAAGAMVLMRRTL
ncbi:MAG: LPS export ABC transporter permease LptG [Chromatiales bacterium]|jgi:lipopolysaccharide export system permease protein|nr:LPS export ABC transporter permease LptG [Chromatiales bacterium]